MRARRTQPRSCCLGDCRSPRQAVAFGLGAGLSGPPGAVGTGWDRRARFGLFPRSDRCREHRWSIGNGAFVKYLEARDHAGVFAGHAFERHILELREARPGAARWTSACPTGRRAWLPCLAPGWYATGRTPLRYGSARPTMVPCEAFAAADGHIMAAAGNDGLGRAFADAAGPWPPRDGSPLRHQPRPRSQPHRLIATLDTTLPEHPSRTRPACSPRQASPSPRSTTSAAPLSTRR